MLRQSSVRGFVTSRALEAGVCRTVPAGRCELVSARQTGWRPEYLRVALLSAQVSLCVGLYFTYPIMLFPAIQILEDTLFTRGALVAESRRSLFRAALVLLTATVALGVPNFGLFISLIGSSCCALLAFVLPCVFYLKLHSDQLGPAEIALNAIAIFVGVAGAVLGTSNSITRSLGILS